MHFKYSTLLCLHFLTQLVLCIFHCLPLIVVYDKLICFELISFLHLCN